MVQQQQERWDWDDAEDEPQPSQRGDNGKYWKTYLSKPGTQLKVLFQRPRSAKEALVASARSHYHPRMKFAYCEPCTKVNEWGDDCAYFLAAVDAAMARGLNEKKAKGEARARTSYFYPVVCTFVDKDGSEHFQGRRLFEVGYRDGNSKDGTIRLINRSLAKRCLCNLGKIEHRGWACPKCGEEVLWSAEDRQNKIVPRCMKCNNRERPTELIACTKNCPRPRRGSIYDCLVVITKQEDGKLHFENEIFGEIPGETLAEAKEPPMQLEEHIKWTPPEQMLLRTGLRQGGYENDGERDPDFEDHDGTDGPGDDIPF